MSASLPENLNIRLYRGEEDIPALVGLFNATAEVDGPEFGVTEEEERQFLNGPTVMPKENLFLFEVDGQLVACGRTALEEGPDESNFPVRGIVHPDWRRRGIGTCVMERVEQRIRERLAEATTRTVHITVVTDLKHQGRLALYERMGYKVARYFFDMERPLRENGVPHPLPKPVYPPGIVVRTMAERPDLEAVWKTCDEAFRDHWGHTETTLEQWQHWTSDPEYRPERWLVAWDSQKDIAAGLCLGAVETKYNERVGREEGWIHVLAVRRPYRHQGLGTALLLAGVEILQEEGMEWAMLGVDTENLTGALRLYERVGFRPTKEYVAYRKTIRS